MSSQNPPPFGGRGAVPPFTPKNSPAAQAADGGRPEQRAVVWMPASTTAPPALLDSLRKRNILVTMTYSGLLTMAHACAAHQQPEKKVGVLVILLEPTKLPAIAEACLGIRRYATRAKLWVYDPKSSQSLRAVSEQDLVNWGAVAPDGTSTEGVLDSYGARGVRSIGAGASFGLKLSGSDAKPRLIGERSTGQVTPDPDDETLSADELRMLLGKPKP
jgi:hypothetical protein